VDNPPLPVGIVTFLFTDIQGSTPLWESRPELMAVALQIHNGVLRRAIQANGGVVFKVVGDAFQASFAVASQALKAAIEAQRGLYAAEWNELGMLKVRMGLHAGEAELDPGGDEYAVSHTKNRVARIMSAGHGGQILLSSATLELLGGSLPRAVTLKDMGEHHLKGLLHPEHLYQVIASDLPSEFPPLKTSSHHSNLPVQTTPFFAREAELARIEALLADPACRLVSLVGIGGAGKSRLAIEAARRTQAYHGSVYFAGLAPAASAAEMLLRIAEAIQYPFYVPAGANLSVEQASGQLLHFLADKRAPLVLDSFEQWSCCAAFLSDVRASAPEIKLLVTSRERLNLPAEWVVEIAGLLFPAAGLLFPTAGLPFPAAGLPLPAAGLLLPAAPGREPPQRGGPLENYAAVQLFVQSAERSVGFNPAEDDWPAIARICSLLEGMPLGVEMAAASVKLVSCAEIAAEIERDLDFLAAAWRSAPERHLTLRAVFETSWRLLTEQEREVFTRLAVFRGGFRREAAARIASATLPMLSTLVDKSLVRRSALDRFEIHPVVKQEAVGKVAAAPSVRAEASLRHAQYYVEGVLRMFGRLQGDEQLATLAAMRAEAQNLRAAFQVLTEQRDFERLEAIYPALILFFEMNNQRVETDEMVGLLAALERTLRSVFTASGQAPNGAGRGSASDGSAPSASIDGLLALTLSALRHFTLDARNPLDDARLAESLALVEPLEDSQTKAYVLLLSCRGPGLASDQKLDLCQQSFSIFKRAGDLWAAALAQLIWADEMYFSGFDYNLARAAYQASLQAFRAAGNLWGQALCLTGLTSIEQKIGKFEEAARLGAQSLDLFTQLENFERAAWLHHIFGEAAVARGYPVEARRHFDANLTFFTNQGDTQRQQYYQGLLERLDADLDCAVRPLE